jgi:glycosyltransferase involved in cell wall biosynthesis
MEGFPKRIGFNGRPLCGPGLRGLSRHTLELIRELRALHPELEVFIYCYAPVDPSYKALLPFATFRDRRVVPKLLWDLVVLPLQLRADGVEVFHSTNNLGVPPRWFGGRNFVTIHDAFTHRARWPWRSPRHWWGSINYRLELALAKRSAAVFTVSSTAGEEIERELGVLAAKLVVAYNGASLPPARPRRCDPFFLYVGGLEERKNIPCLLAGVELFNEGAVDRIPLVLVGKLADAAPAVRRTLAERTDLFQVLEGVSDADLAQLYADARALIFPSKEEGFGLPLVEAFSLSCPTIVSDIKVFRELAEDAALFFPPDSPAALARQMRRLTENPELRAELVAKGQGRAPAFRWEELAATVSRTYLSFAGSRDTLEERGVHP